MENEIKVMLNEYDQTIREVIYEDSLDSTVEAAEGWTELRVFTTVVKLQ